MKDNIILAEYRKKLEIAEKQREAGKALGQNTNKLKNRCKAYRSCIRNLERNNEEILKLREGNYYIVSVAANNSDAVHRAVMHVGHDRAVSLFNHSYDKEVERYSIESISYLRVVEVLHRMN